MIEMIESTEELDAALAVLGELDALVAVANANLDQAIAAVRTEHEANFQATLDSGEQLPISELRENLVGCIERYCEKHRKRLLTGDKKSLDLSHGVIGWRKKRDAVVDLVQSEEEKGKGLLAKAHKLMLAALAAIKLMLGKVTVASCMKVDLKWDRAQLLKAFNDKQITKAALAKQGLKVERGEDEFYCEAKSEKRTV